MKIKQIELEPGDDLRISFQGLWDTWSIEVSYSSDAIRVHRRGSRDPSGNGRIHDIHKLRRFENDSRRG